MMSAFFKFVVLNNFFLKYTQWQCIVSYDNKTEMYKFLKILRTGGIRTRNLLTNLYFGCCIFDGRQFGFRQKIEKLISI
jgi:hypothetical protein